MTRATLKVKSQVRVDTEKEIGMAIKLRRIKFGKWNFSYAFGRYRIGIRRQAKRAGSIGFGIGVLTYLRTGQYVPLTR